MPEYSQVEGLGNMLRDISPKASILVSARPVCNAEKRPLQFGDST